jgi:hypothetical protein
MMMFVKKMKKFSYAAALAIVQLFETKQWIVDIA